MLPGLINFDPSKIDPFLALSTENYSLAGELTRAFAPFHFSFNYSQQVSNINLIKSWSGGLLWVCQLGGSPGARCCTVTCSQASWNPSVWKSAQKIAVNCLVPEHPPLPPRCPLHRTGHKWDQSRDESRKRNHKSRRCSRINPDALWHH